MHAPSKHNIQAIILALIGFAFFNSADAFLKEATEFYETSFTGFSVVTMELFICLALSPFLGGLKPIIQTKRPKLNILRGLFSSGCWIFFILGIQYVDLAPTYSILLSAPFWSALLAMIIFKISIGYHRWIAIVVGFIGVLVVMRPGMEGFQLASLLPLLSSFCFAGMAIITRYIGEGEKPITLAFYILFTECVIMFIYTCVQGAWVPIQPEHLPVFIASAACYAVGVLTTNKAFSIGDTAAVNPMQYSQIIWGALIGYIFFAEVPERWTLLGAAIIIASGIYLIYRENKVKQENVSISKR